MRYGYATVALPTLTPEAAVDELSAHGYEGVEWKVGEPGPAIRRNAVGFLDGNLCTFELSEREGARAGEIARAAGLAVIGLNPYIEMGDLAGLRTAVTMADAAGASHLRLQGPRPTAGGPGYTELFARFLDFLASAVHLVRGRPVRLLIELHHKTIVPSAGLASPLIRRFDPAVLGVIYDVGNLVYEGFEAYDIAIEVLGPYLQHVHLKNVGPVRGEDGRWTYDWAPLDDGLVDVSRVLDALAAAGYAGWVSIEDLSDIRDPVHALRHNARVLRLAQASASARRTGPPCPSTKGT